MSDNQRMEALSALLDELSIGENQGYVKAVSGNNNEVYFHFDHFPVPMQDNPLLNMFTRTWATMDKELHATLVRHAWANMARLPLFASILMPAPTVGTMLTGVPSRAHIDATEQGLAELEELYAKMLREHGGDPVAFASTDEARKIIDGAIAAAARRDMQVCEYKSYAPMAWTPIVTSAMTYVYYARVIDVLTMTVGFSHDNAEVRQLRQKRINEAEEMMRKNIEQALKDAISQSGLSPHISRARHSVVGARFLDVDTAVVCRLVERACVDFTYKVLSEMERWILTVWEIPKELHAPLLCAAQPRIGLKAGKLASDDMQWQEELREARVKAFPSIWHTFWFDEEFCAEDPVRINDLHLSRAEYKMNVFGALVRMTYDDSTVGTLAVQYTSRVRDRLALDELSPIVNTPITLYGAEEVDCAGAFSE